MTWHLSELHSFVWFNEYSIVCINHISVVHLSVDSSVNTWIISTFWLLPRTWVFKYLFVPLLSLFWGIYLGMELLEHVLILCLTFEELPSWTPSILRVGITRLPLRN